MQEPDRDRVCPHCHLPAQMPATCSPELHAVIEAQIRDAWDLFNRGYAAGKRAALEIAQSTAGRE